MRKTDVIMAIDGIIYDSKLRLDKNEHPGTTIQFCFERFEALKKQLLLERKYNGDRL
jgi:hypothetical protein